MLEAKTANKLKSEPYDFDYLKMSYVREEHVGRNSNLMKTHLAYLIVDKHILPNFVAHKIAEHYTLQNLFVNDYHQFYIDAQKAQFLPNLDFSGIFVMKQVQELEKIELAPHIDNNLSHFIDYFAIRKNKQWHH